MSTCLCLVVRQIESMSVTKDRNFVVVLIALSAALRAVGDRSIVTAAGELQTVQLPDGSTVRAGSRTHATVVFTKHERIIRLLQGEIMLQVAREPARPLYVETDLAFTRAVGTAFAVRHFSHDSVVVTVQEGKVAVTREAQPVDQDRRDPAESATVSAGEQVRVTSQGGPLEVHPVDLDKELAWTTGRLLFTTETIGEAVREFNLRNETQIALLGPGIGRRPVRGVFSVDRPRDFALFLARSADLALVDNGAGTLSVALKAVPETPVASDSRGN